MRKMSLLPIGAALAALTWTSFCADSSGRPAAGPAASGSSRPAASLPATRPLRGYKVVHVLVALCDNKNQGIVPVPAALGNGQAPATNLYWGAQFGLKTFFARSAAWKSFAVRAEANEAAVLDRLAFRSTGEEFAVWLVAEAYDGAKMKDALRAFFESAAGARPARFTVGGPKDSLVLDAGAASDLVCFVGHDGLMDAALENPPKQRRSPRPDGAIVLACKSRSYFAPLLKEAGCPLLLATTGLMCPEAYTLDAAVRAWAEGGKPSAVAQRAAAAYAKYQKCSESAAAKLLVTDMPTP